MKKLILAIAIFCAGCAIPMNYNPPVIERRYDDKNHLYEKVYHYKTQTRAYGPDGKLKWKSFNY